ncbi:MAG: hypothetical protein U0X75_27105 [Acidobacteriota bacterium]
MFTSLQTSLRLLAGLAGLVAFLFLFQTHQFRLLGAASAQLQQRTVTVDVDLPSASTVSATGTLAVRIFAPSSATLARYSEGAPVMVFATGGDDVGTLANQVGRAEDVIRIVFVYPGGRDLTTGRASAGTYDFRGANSIAAMRDVILYAAGQLRDSNGKRLNDVVQVPVLNNNIGLFGSSNGGNMVVSVLAHHGAQLSPYVKYFIQWESPVCSQVATSDAGATQLTCAGNRQTLASGNPWYNAAGNTATSLNIDYSRARHNPANTTTPVFFDGNGDGSFTLVSDPARPGCQTPDLNGDGRISTSEDRQLGAYRMTGNKQVYSRQATQGLAATGTVASWPANIATVTEANAFWDIREAVLLYQTAINNVPGLESMVLTSFTDHVQTQMTENAHVKMAFDGMNSRGRWVKINPARSYYTAIDAALSSRTDIPNNTANTAPANWSDRRGYTYPDDLDQTAWAAAVQEMADRARARTAQPTPTPTPTATPTPTPTPTPVPTPTPGARSMLYISGTMHIESNRLRWPNVDALLAFFTRATKAGRVGSEPAGMKWSVGADIGWLTGEPRAGEVIAKLEAMGVEMDVHAHSFSDRANCAARITQLGGHPNKVSSGNVVTEIDGLRQPVVGANGATWQAEILYGTALRPDHSPGSEDVSYGVWRPKSGAEYKIHDPGGNLISVGGGVRTLAGATAIIDKLKTLTGLPPVYSTTIMVHPDTLVNVTTQDGIAQIEAWATTARANSFVKWATLSETAAAWKAAGQIASRVEDLNTLVGGITNPPATVAAVNAASYGTGALAMESIISLFGNNLATGTQVSSTLPLPTQLAGTIIKVKDSAGSERSAPLFFVSPNQINCQIPPGTLPGAATITVISDNSVVAAGSVQIANAAPGLFTSDGSGNSFAAGYVLRVKTNGAQIVEQIARWDSAQNKMVAVPIDLSGNTDQLYLVGFGTGFRYRSSLAAVTATIGGENSQVLYAGEQNGFVGVDQINLLLPKSLAGRGEVNLTLTVDGQTSNSVKLQFR